MDGILEAIKKDPIPWITAIVGPLLLAVGNWTQSRLARDRGEGKQDEAAAATQMTFIDLTTTQIKELKQQLVDQRANFDGKITRLREQLDLQAKAHTAELDAQKSKYEIELADRDQRLVEAAKEKIKMEAQISNLQTLVIDQGAQILRLAKRLDDSQGMAPAVPPEVT